VGQDTGVVDVDAGAGKPGLNGRGDELAACTRIPRHYGARPCTFAGAFMAKHDGGGLGQLQCELGCQQAIRQAPDTVCSK
jgi:hypothetical protein